MIVLVTFEEGGYFKRFKTNKDVLGFVKNLRRLAKKFVALFEDGTRYDYFAGVFEKNEGWKDNYESVLDYMRSKECKN